MTRPRHLPDPRRPWRTIPLLRCIDCKQWTPAHGMHVHRNTKGYLRFRCKDCAATKTQEASHGPLTA